MKSVENTSSHNRTETTFKLCLKRTHCKHITYKLGHYLDDKNTCLNAGPSPQPHG